MKIIPVRLKEHSHPIIVGSGILSSLGMLMKKQGLGPDAVVITNPLVKKLHGAGLARALARAGFTVRVFEVEDSEKSKSAAVASALIEKIAAYSADKKPVIIAFGGGVTGDLAGFVASVYKRGIPFVQVPTTLLAQIDSAIGGKVAVDLPSGKNLMGAFYQPRLVLVDVAFLGTLSDRQVRNGLAEAVKYGVIRDAGLFTFLENRVEALLAREPLALKVVVERCAAIKAGVVSRDEKELKGLRVILNFGHTVGHAIEAAAGYDRYQHGEAVAIGMRAATRISLELKLIKPVDAARLNALLTILGLPQRAKGVAFRKVLRAMSFDKKFSGKKNRFVLPTRIGKVIVKEAVPEGAVLAAIRCALS